MPDQETIYVVGQEHTVYHTDPDCDRIPREPRAVSRQRFPDLEECAYCAGKANRGGDGSPSELRLFLEEADVEEVWPDGGSGASG